jgi:type IV pilus assembly protein PilM
MAGIKDFLSGLGSGSSAGVVGVDIGSSSIKVVELEERKGVLTLMTYGEIQLGPYVADSVGQSVILNPEQEQAALVDVIRESAVHAREAVFAMPLSSSFVTNVSVNIAPDTDLSAMVRVEARKVIPASLSEVSLDWIEVDIQDNAKKTSEEVERKILIAAIQNVALDRFRALMNFTGFRRPPTEIECFSVVRALLQSEDKHMAIIDIGANSAKLYIAKDGLLMRMHRIRAGGAIATEAIAKELSLKFEAAELRKQTLTRDNVDFAKIQKIHHSTYDRAFREFRQVLSEYETKNNVKLDFVYLAGGSAIFPGTDTLLKDALGKEVFISNPFKKVSYPAFMADMMKEIGPSFTVAVGAALRAFE